MGTDIPDPDGIGWNYHIYRSHEGGTFITDVGRFEFGFGDRNLALFRHFRGKGFVVQDSHGNEIHISLDAVRSMSFIAEDRG